MKILFIGVVALLLSPTIKAQTPGERVSAELEGKWIDAEFLEFKIGLYRVKLDTDTTMWVTKDRIRLNYAIGDIIKAEWLGSWYPATITEQKGDMYKVRFHEMKTEVLEWVKMEQMQKLK
jgi:aromatic ring-cleaving dioxygenase